MIQAVIHPETKEFLGLIIPAVDLKEGGSIAIYGSAADWAAAMLGEAIPAGRIKVVRTSFSMDPNCKVTIAVDRTDQPQQMEVDNVDTRGDHEQR